MNEVFSLLCMVFDLRYFKKRNEEERQGQDLSAGLGSNNFWNINATNFQITSVETLIVKLFYT